MKTDKKGPLGALILAAGQGTRMYSSTPKVLHRIGGRPMIHYTLRLAAALKPAGIGIVVGHEAELVQKTIQESLSDWGITRPVTFIHQKSLTGSGAAVLESLPFLRRYKTALVTAGDTPLLTFDTLHAALKQHEEQKGQVTMLSARLRDPRGYGRIVRSPLGEVVRIVEELDATPKEAAITEVNSGSYIFEVALLMDVVKKLSPKNAKKELYLTDALEHIRTQGGRVSAHLSATGEECQGVNNRLQLANAERILNRRMLERLMLAGVTVLDPNTTYVDADVEVGQDTVLLPGTILRGKTRIGGRCRIGPWTHVEDSTIGNDCEVISSYVRGARLLEKTKVGPYSHVRPQTTAGPRARIGSFSEVKASRIGYGSKVPHLSYIGDADIAEDVNVGAGTITCNFDGKEKHRTVIGARAFIGSNVNLVAPVKIGRGALLAAGSTITEDVPEGALAIARERQINKARK